MNRVLVTEVSLERTSGAGAIEATRIDFSGEESDDDFDWQAQATDGPGGPL